MRDGDRFHLVPQCFESRRDIDPVAHRVAFTLLDHVAEVDANPELDAALVRQAGARAAAPVSDAH